MSFKKAPRRERKMGGGSNIDPTLRALKSLGRYQILQVFAITIGSFGAAYQLLGNIFIGKSFWSSFSFSSSLALM